ncbi:RagB/SusD family nutrient uptake outer membrane protein [Mucilaginibacter sp. RS28]|uniref:RagB/SusD family nutrient uptake outer membrane protein n=1 Tax=Mucilaginibacter straminoryzae TaxID=2932774 RepID=A0A9X2BAF2_9SPHI|nr:RagB/SusD family nutrient uptake outer membrane protein [Mucilaginibacter straminoryzae]MCJ8208727.1 RagB/SusD family nutrient uptake outer membrane protein [Mucilaginibacter straminoryzae]
MKKLNKKLLIGASALAMLNFSCTKLNEQLYGSKFIKDGNTAAGSADLGGVYNQLNGFSDQANWYALEEHSTDEMMGPTRGTDWDDFGTWRKLHQHTWDPTHNQIYDTWNNLNTGVYRATSVIAGATDNQIKAEASFLRAFFMFWVVDLYGQQPFRNVTDDPDANPMVMTRKAATDYMIKDLEFAVATLPAGSLANAGKANKYAAEFLLAKIYLNKAVYYQDPATPAGPFTFQSADMNKALGYLNDIINNGPYSLTANYYDNFKWDNTSASKEIIFSRQNDPNTGQNASLENRTRMVEHYNTTPSGWNGFTTLAAFYNSFEDNDIRKKYNLPNYTEVTGQNVGFLVGQQKTVDSKGNLVNVLDRSGKPLIFTPNVNIGYATEAEGIRAVKFPLNPTNFGQSGNDYVFFRFADVLLMKAEAILRGGTDAAQPLALVNQIRANRGASLLTSLDLPGLLAERGREMYWESWRRQDLIRFGKFNDPVDQRSTASAGYRVVYPIPQRAVDSNPNLKQNTGY